MLRKLSEIQSSFFYSVAIIIVAIILAGAYKYKYKQSENITVTGVAEKNFKSDIVVWSAHFSRSSMSIADAYSKIKQDEKAIQNYLNKQNIDKNEIKFSAINTDKQYDQKYDTNGRIIESRFIGYRLTESFSIESKDLEKVEKVTREITELLQKDIEISSDMPSYYYSRLDELKIDLLAKASAEGRHRAEVIAKNAGKSLGTLSTANMGVFQITGQNSNENYEGGGTFNTSSINKTARITLRMIFK